MIFGTLPNAIMGSSTGLSMLAPNAVQTLQALVELGGHGTCPDSFLPSQHLTCFTGLAAIGHTRLLKTSPAIRLFASGRFDLARRLNLSSEIDMAFHMQDVTRLSGDPSVRRRQEDLITRVASTAGANLGIMMLLFIMKEQLDSHNYHSLRAGIMYASLREVFNPRNPLPPETLLLVGILHDVGKLEVEEEILFKEGELNLEETQAMRRHNEATCRILAPFQDTMPYMSEVAIHHHPYPISDMKRRGSDRRRKSVWMASEQRSGADRREAERRMPKRHIRRAGFLLRIADTYDALASRRDYKPPFSASEVSRIMFENFPLFGEQIRYLLSIFPCPVS